MSHALSRSFRAIAFASHAAAVGPVGRAPAAAAVGPVGPVGRGDVGALIEADDGVDEGMNEYGEL